MRDKQEILKIVKEVFNIQFEMYTWEDMIDDIADVDLTSEEKAWAKENISYEVKMDEQEETK